MRSDRRGDDRVRVERPDVLRDRDGRTEPRDRSDMCGARPVRGTDGHRVEEAALRFVEERVEGERRLTRSGNPDDCGQAGTEGNVDVAKVVLRRARNVDGPLAHLPARTL